MMFAQQKRDNRFVAERYSANTFRLSRIHIYVYVLDNSPAEVIMKRRVQFAK